jgi:uncharacterized membrane protein YhaH (DUF805 family)
MLDLGYVFSFRGRMRRAHWWLSRLAAWVLPVILLVATGTLSVLESRAGLPRSPGFWVGLAIVGPFALWLDVAASVKRLHDIGISGWAYLMVFIPYVGSLAAFIVMGCLDGTRGPNRFGASPKWPDLTREAMLFE